jgi:hypothetical protein
MVFVLAVCAILTLSFLIACDRPPTKFDDPPDGPEDFLTPEDSAAIAKALDYIEVYGGEHGITEPGSQLLLASVSFDDGEKAHVRFFQVYEGVKVYGSWLYLWVHPSGEVELIRISFDPDVKPAVSLTPTISGEETLEMWLLGYEPLSTSASSVSGPVLWIRLVDGQYLLGWHIKASWPPNGQPGDNGMAGSFWFDAHTGVLFEHRFITF